ncbi:uncharacterized protein [Arachis hypogaea]|uniref:uncharacterized protein isoform X2 n=1 Tax=Arachis hypogaea TaxID=3818 RepID=UPI000DED1A4C|nr:transcription factor TGAL3-like isoform X2 [Arachis hypogaea]
MKTTVEKYLRSTLHSLSYLSNNKAGNGELVVVDSNDQTKLKHEDQKTLRRLAQNCEAARKSRLRKKIILAREYLNDVSISREQLKYLVFEAFRGGCQTFNGKKWEKFNSEKVASLAYARVQGKAALVNHFQNSISTRCQ